MSRKPLTVNVISESAFTVQGHGVHTAFVEHVNSLKKMPGIKVLTNADTPDADITHVHTIGPYSVKKMRKAKGTIVISGHLTPDSFVGSLIGARLWYPLAKAYLKWFYNHADLVLAVSAEVRHDLIKKLGVTSRVEIIPNSIDTRVFKAAIKQRAKLRRKFKIKPDQFVVIGVGQIQPRKRIDSFIKAAEGMPKAIFIWVGGIPFKHLAAGYKEMNHLVETAPANMRFVGIRPLKEVRDYYAASDVFFLPSDQETFGIVIVEAAATGLPVLLRDIAQYRQTFSGEYAKGKDKDFVKILKRLSSNPKYYRYWQGQAAKISAHYDAQTIVKQLLKEYDLAMKIHHEQ